MTSLSEDKATMAVDRQKLKGFVLHWRKSKILLGCAVFHDALRLPAILCKVLQDSELCVVRAIEGFYTLLKMLKNLKQVHLRNFHQLNKCF